MKLPKLTFDDFEENKPPQTCVHNDSKPPIVKKHKFPMMHKSSEKSLKQLSTLAGEGDKLTTHESSKNMVGRLTPSFCNRNMGMNPSSSYEAN